MHNLTFYTHSHTGIQSYLYASESPKYIYLVGSDYEQISMLRMKNFISMCVYLGK